jgi:hypothetical protein
MTVALVLPFDLNLAASLETLLATILSASQVSFKDHLTFCLLNCMLSTKGLLLAKDMNIDKLVYYSDALHCVNLIKGPQVRYHIHAVLI